MSKQRNYFSLFKSESAEGQLVAAAGVATAALLAILMFQRFGPAIGSLTGNSVYRLVSCASGVCTPPEAAPDIVPAGNGPDPTNPLPIGDTATLDYASLQDYVAQTGNTTLDGIFYQTVLPLDLNGDGLLDAYGIDLDADGTPDIVDTTGDIVNYLDLNGDGQPDALTLDYNLDGVVDKTLYENLAAYLAANPNAQLDLANFIPFDANGDGVFDLAGVDIDGDGIPDLFETLNSGVLTTVDSDGDGQPDGFAIDANQDGVAEQQLVPTVPLPVFLDADGDGMLDPGKFSSMRDCLAAGACEFNDLQDWDDLTFFLEDGTVIQLTELDTDGDGDEDEQFVGGLTSGAKVIAVGVDLRSDDDDVPDILIVNDGSDVVLFEDGGIVRIDQDGLPGYETVSPNILRTDVDGPRRYDKPLRIVDNQFAISTDYGLNFGNPDKDAELITRGGSQRWRGDYEDRYKYWDSAEFNSLVFTEADQQRLNLLNEFIEIEYVNGYSINHFPNGYKRGRDNRLSAYRDRNERYAFFTLKQPLDALLAAFPELTESDLFQVPLTDHNAQSSGLPAHYELNAATLNGFLTGTTLPGDILTSGYFDRYERARVVDIEDIISADINSGPNDVKSFGPSWLIAGVKAFTTAAGNAICGPFCGALANTATNAVFGGGWNPGDLVKNLAVSYIGSGALGFGNVGDQLAASVAGSYLDDFKLTGNELLNAGLGAATTLGTNWIRDGLVYDAKILGPQVGQSVASGIANLATGQTDVDDVLINAAANAAGAGVGDILANTGIDGVISNLGNTLVTDGTSTLLNGGGFTDFLDTTAPNVGSQLGTVTGNYIDAPKEPAPPGFKYQFANGDWSLVPDSSNPLVLAAQDEITGEPDTMGEILVASGDLDRLRGWLPGFNVTYERNGNSDWRIMRTTSSSHPNMNLTYYENNRPDDRYIFTYNDGSQIEIRLGNRNDQIASVNQIGTPSGIIPVRTENLEWIIKGFAPDAASSIQANDFLRGVTVNGQTVGQNNLTQRVVFLNGAPYLSHASGLTDLSGQTVTLPYSSNRDLQRAVISTFPRAQRLAIRAGQGLAFAEAALDLLDGVPTSRALRAVQNRSSSGANSSTLRNDYASLIRGSTLPDSRKNELIRYLNNGASPSAVHARLISNCSFSADTAVKTVDGLKPIAQIRVGELVYAYDELNNVHGYFPVSDTWSHDDPTVIHLVLQNEVIETTPDHPFYRSDGSWVPAGELVAGDTLNDASWGELDVLAIYEEQVVQTMHNLTVTTAHTYYIGENELLVHNSCRPHQKANLESLSIGGQNSAYAKALLAHVASNGLSTRNVTIAVIQSGGPDSFVAALNGSAPASVRKLLEQVADSRSDLVVVQAPPRRGAEDHAERYLYESFVAPAIKSGRLQNGETAIGISHSGGACPNCRAFFNKQKYYNLYWDYYFETGR